ncbi:MAG: stage III sporulation protein AF [Peptococcaceae bacterium]|nr:stage III sporulation protein AF [Peptococcaceae bacterium]
MEFVIGLMRQISIIAVLAAFLELLLPNGEMQKFIRFFMGLLILVAFLNPLIKGQLFAGEIAAAEMADILETETAGNLSTEEILAAGREIDTALFTKAEEEVKEDISLQILALVRLVSGVEQAAVDISFAEGAWSGDLELVRLTVIASSGTDTAEIEADIYRLLEAFYHLPQEKVQCVIKEAAANDSN